MRIYLLGILWLFLYPSVTAAQEEIHLDSLAEKATKTMLSGDLAKSLQLHLQLLEIHEKKGNTDQLDDVLSQIAWIYQLQGNNSKSREYIDRSIKISRQTYDSTRLARSLVTWAILEFNEGDMDSSAILFKESAALYKAVGWDESAAQMEAKLGNILEAQKKYDEATPYFEQFAKMAIEANDSILMLGAYFNLTSNAYNLKQYEKAYEFMKIARAFSEDLERDYEYQQSLVFETLILAGLGDERVAEVLNTYISHHDSIVNTTSASQLADLEARYETQKKQATIELQEELLSSQRRGIWFLTALFTLAIIGGIILYRLTQKLKKRNEEKEFLIKEIHHRVKNNLQVLSSLLNLQSRHIADSDALYAVREGQNRVDAMGLIHQKLYTGDNLAAVDMKDYIQNLGDTLLDSFGAEERVAINYDLQPLRFDVDTAIPMGLIINELVTNSLKYAFPEEGRGVIDISLWKDESGKLLLKVADNGSGTATVEAMEKSTSFGTSLINMLSKKLRGIPQVFKEQGYATLIAFERFQEV